MPHQKLYSPPLPIAATPRTPPGRRAKALLTGVFFAVALFGETAWSQTGAAQAAAKPSITHRYPPPLPTPTPEPQIPSASAAPETQSPKPKAQDPEPLVIGAISWRGFGLVIQASAPMKPEIFVLKAPHRFVVDLPAAEFADTQLAKTIPIHAGTLAQVRLAKKENGSVRLVVDCTEATPLQVMQIGDRSTLVIAPAGRANAGIEALTTDAATYSGTGQEISSLWVHEAAGTCKLHLGGAKPLTYAIFQPDATHVQVRIPRGRYAGFLPLPGKLLERATVKTAPDGSWTLDVALSDGHYRLGEQTSGDRTGLTLTWDREEPRRFPGAPLVVIDPGHGGNDPGAIGPGGKTEKSINLSLAQALQLALARRRINAILTRSADTEMLLAPRLGLIDQLQANFFVSIHANSHTTPDTSGIETYWREPASQAFAEQVHRHVAGQLHRLDRGVKQERLYVLRHTRVPSLLLETGFISNPAEERLMDDQSFQAQAAGAIAAGIERYMASPPLARSP